MNSEELEQSLKSEFESYLKTVLAEMKQETAEFQKNIEAEFEKQRSQIDEAFKGFAARFDSERAFDAAFSGSVGQHLRLARDEGARIAANAMVEAENLGQSPLSAVEPPPPVEVMYDAIRDAVSDIGSKDSQSSILKSLVQHAAGFAPRGAFFIIKSDHLAGWRVFGASDAAENVIRDINFPVSSDSILGAAVAARSTVDNAERTYGGDAAFINPLEYGEPKNMFAIPLVARGRAVAVLYADHGVDSEPTTPVNREALETIVRVAGLTVELLASMQAAKVENRTVAAADFEDVETQAEAPVTPESQHETFEVQRETATDLSTSVSAPVFESPFQEPVAETPSPYIEDTAATEPTKEEPAFSFSDSVSFEGGFTPQEASANPFDAEPASFGQFEGEEKHEVPSPVESDRSDSPFAELPYPGDEAARLAEVSEKSRASDVSFQPETFNPPTEPFRQPFETFIPPVETFEQATEKLEEIETKGSDMLFDKGSTLDEGPAVSSPFEQPREQYEPAAAVSGGGFAQQVGESQVVEAPFVQASKPRLRDRNVDLPIEVPEEERRMHNDARRFARLLVSEIKLYNEKKVTEGRESSDLYERLREAIDRSREMYDKRVQPPVAAKFDYFHYELVNSLAEGTAERLGNGYPGANV